MMESQTIPQATPILGQIRSKNLTNVLVVVVRYFGGVKLGVGGLVSAYKTAAEEALNHATMVEREVLIQYNVRYPYTSTPDVMKLVKDFELDILHQSFEAECKNAYEPFVAIKKYI
jgi:putative IMPACT (imprinted ancient) family translation regulator